MLDGKVKCFQVTIKVRRETKSPFLPLWFTVFNLFALVSPARDAEKL